MPVNISRSRQPRLWELWQISGAVHKPSSYAPEFTTDPPPCIIVVREIDSITCMLDRLETYAKRRLSRIQHRVSFDQEVTWVTRLLEETREARRQVNLCEYLIAREYLGFVRGAGKGAQQRIAKINRRLKWCEENDRRGSYTWLPILQLAAA